MKNIKYNVSFSYTDKHSFYEELTGNAFAPYLTSVNNGAILTNKPGQKVYDNNGNPIPAPNWDDDDGMEDTMCDYNQSVEIATEIITDFAPDKAIAFIYPCKYDLRKQSWYIPENKTPAYTITTMDKALLNKLNFTADLLVEV